MIFQVVEVLMNAAAAILGIRTVVYLLCAVRASLEVKKEEKYAGMSDDFVPKNQGEELWVLEYYRKRRCELMQYVTVPYQQ